MATKKRSTRFGYSCPECGIGTVQPTQIKNYKTRIKGHLFRIDEALVGICDHCDTEHFSGQETKRWKRLFEEKMEAQGAFLSADEIAQLRKKLGLSKDELACLIGCTRQSISTWENPDRTTVPSRMADLLLKLVRASYVQPEVDVISFLLNEANALTGLIQIRRSLAHTESE